MSAKISKTNDNLEFFNSRLDEIRMNGHERLKAKARVAQAEAFADAGDCPDRPGQARLQGRRDASLPRAARLRPAEPNGGVPAVAVQRLNPKHREDIARHLLQLPENDRRLRFGHAIRDSAIRAYVDSIDFDRDRVFGVHGPPST